MKNLFISNLNQKDVAGCTSDLGLYARKALDKPFKKLCNFFTNANIVEIIQDSSLSDDEYFNGLSLDKVPLSDYNLNTSKNNIILERYPKLEENESYIFVCNHTCPEDIETVLNILDRNAYLVLGSLESLQYNPEMYLLWLNGMLPFDILNSTERKDLLPKMERIIKTNSILIFPEGSHNYTPNRLINNLFDGPVNLALNTGKKIVAITMVKDKNNNVSYIDVSNPIDISNLDINIKDYYSNGEENKKYLVKSLSSYIRDRMATAVYYMISRHLDLLRRDDYQDIDNYFRNQYITDAFTNLKWDHDVFDAEYLVKKTKEDLEYEAVIRTLSNLKLKKETLKKTGIINRDYILKKTDLDSKNVAAYMRNYWVDMNNSSENKTLIKK